MKTEFLKYYNQWKEETQFLSTGMFDNENFKALCDPYIIPIKDLINGAYDILSEKDDFIVHALDIRFELLLGEPLFTYEGYVSLDTACKSWLIVLTSILSEEPEEIKHKFLMESFEIVDK